MAHLRDVRGGALSSSAFGERMHGTGAHAAAIRGMFDVAADRAGMNKMKWRMSTEHFRRPSEQLDIFSDRIAKAMLSDVTINASLVIPLQEPAFRLSRSGGPGGQHVNKTETRVELIFDVAHSTCLNDRQRMTLVRVLAPRLDTRGCLHVVCSEERSQLRNRERAVEIFARVVTAALRPRKKRLATAPTRAARERRIQEKKMIGERKRGRSARDDE